MADLSHNGMIEWFDRCYCQNGRCKSHIFLADVIAIVCEMMLLLTIIIMFILTDDIVSYLIIVADVKPLWTSIYNG